MAAEGGFEHFDASHLNFSEFAMKPILAPSDSHLWPRNGRVQTWRQDHTCTSMKLLAFNFTQFDAVMVSDSDVCMFSDPGPWMEAQYKANQYFIASHEAHPAVPPPPPLAAPRHNPRAKERRWQNATGWGSTRT
mmetsp:Transcript_48488/g.160683  ORF Transcript_48488/g.160683 Transcript_48488/m.160683 type:complete len:134 (+) Transcript_48488:677-1078(+)